MKAKKIVWNLVVALHLSCFSPLYSNEFKSWSKETWVSYLNSQLDKPLEAISWKGMGAFLQKPDVVQALDNLNMLKCTERYREMVAYRNLIMDPNKIFGHKRYEYYEKVEKLYPNIFALPKELERGFPQDIEALVAKKASDGWEILWRKKGESRFILHVPNNGYGYDQWYNVGVHQEVSSTPFVVAQMTIIQWQEVIDGRVKKYFTPYLIETVAKGFGYSTLNHPRRLSSQCRQCHTSGIHDIFKGDDPSALSSSPLFDLEELVISPKGLRGKVFKVDELKQLVELIYEDGSVEKFKAGELMRKKMNDTLHSYGILDWRGDREREVYSQNGNKWAGWYQVEKLGPPLELLEESFDLVGLEKLLATKQEKGLFVYPENRYVKVPADPQAWVSKANCANCHDSGASRGILNLNLGPTGWKHVKEKLADKSMPMKAPYPGAHTKLFESLKSSYPKQLIEWVNLKACLN